MKTIVRAMTILIIASGVFNSSAQSDLTFEIMIQGGHTRTILSLSVSPDNTLLATGGQDKTVILWDLQSGVQLRTFEGHSNDIERVVFTPDSRYLLTGSRDKTIKMWDVVSGNLLHTFESHRDGISGMAVNHDGHFFATSSWDNTLCIWDLSERKLTQTIMANAKYLLDVSLSPDGTKVAGAGKDGTVRIWEVGSGRELKSIPFNEEGVVDVAFSNDGSCIAAGGLDSQFKMIEWTSGRTLWSANDHYRGQISFSEDSRLVAYSGVVVKEWKTGKSVATFTNHKDIVYGVDFTQDSKYVISAGGNRQISIWNVEQKSLVKTFGGTALGVTAGDLSSNEKTFVMATDNYMLKTWDMARARITASYEGHTDQIKEVKWSPDGSRLLSASADGSGRLWDTQNQSILHSIEFPKEVYCGVFSDDGGYFALGGEKNLIRIYNNSTLALVKELTPKKKSEYNLPSVRSLDFSDDGSLLASGLFDGTASIWKVPAGKEIQQLHIHEWYIMGLQLSHDGSRLLTASGDKSTKITDVKTGQEIGKYVKTSTDQYSLYLESARFSPDEKWIVTGNTDKTVMLYSTQDAVFKELKGHKGIVYDAGFSDDGKELLSFGGQTTNLWDSDGKLKVSFIASKDGGYAAVTPDGYYTFSKEAYKSVFFVKGLKSYSFENFDLIYNRPDKVMERIGKSTPEMLLAYRTAWEKRVQKMGFDPSVFESLNIDNVPEIALYNLPNTLIQWTSATLKFSISAKDHLYNLDRLFLTINGVPLHGIKGKSLLANPSMSIQQDIDVPLGSGKNVIKVSVMNEKGVESLAEQFEVTYKPLMAIKPDLHVVAIGVSKFQQSDYNLTYADKDANDLMALLKSATGYEEVYIHCFTNEQATLENILTIRSQLEKTKVDDEVVVFVASHGLLDSELDYYIALHNTDFVTPKVGGLHYDKLEELLDGIPARNKLLLIDACHSGEVDKEESTLIAANTSATNSGAVKSRGFKTVQIKSTGIGLQSSFELMKELFADLRRNNGSVVISSASGKEFAFESAEWQNGVFTYSLLEGLKSGNADANKDKIISVTEIRDYVGKRVNELTNGKQTPTSRTENLENDFRVW